MGSEYNVIGKSYIYSSVYCSSLTSDKQRFSVAIENGLEVRGDILVSFFYTTFF